MRLDAKTCLIIVIGICFVLTCCKSAKTLHTSIITINPLQYGLNEAKTGEDRYYVLQKTHKEAERMGVGVSYAGVKKIELTIPAKVKTIPLTHYTDFAGAIITVENKRKDIYLFSISSDLMDVEASGKEIDNQDFSNNNVLKTGNRLLIVKDKTPWVDNRIGYDYGATRKDIMLVKDGKSGHSPVQSYCTIASRPECSYRDVDVSAKLIIKDVVFNRTENSTKITRFVKIENQYNVELSNITINTPEGSGLYGDKAIYVVNCSDVVLTGVTINGTYSLPGKYGYGIALNNTYNVSFYDLYARGNWGVFGNSNVHKAFLKNCDINRFDIHCYGKDISFEDCNFVNLYNQFSSVYGLISFTNCNFSNFTPILIGRSYNAYTAYDVRFEECTFNLDKKHNSIINFSGFTTEENKRPELKEKCLPNVTMSDCRVNLAEGMKKWYVYNTKKTKDYEGRFSHISEVRIEGLSTNSSSATMEVFSKNIETVNQEIVK